MDRKEISKIVFRPNFFEIGMFGLGDYELSSRAADHTASQLTSIHICFPEQGGNMATTMSWGFSNFRHLFCFTQLIDKACMYRNHIPLLYIFNGPANECWVCMCQSRTPIPNMQNLHNILYKILYAAILKPCVEQKKKYSIKYFRNIS